MSATKLLASPPRGLAGPAWRPLAGLALAGLLIPALGLAGKPGKTPKSKENEAETVAVAYLQALAGEGDPKARQYLLGGVPLAAREYSIPNWNIVEREPARVEKKPIAEVRDRLRALENTGHKALTEVLRAKRPDASAIDRARAKELLGVTQTEAQRFGQDYPVFAYVARVGKDVFWHPRNPWRQVVKDLGEAGSYELELHLFRIEEREPNRPPRVWPLRVLRIRTDQGYDSGWKVLPASDWDPEY